MIRFRPGFGGTAPLIAAILVATAAAPAEAQRRPKGVPPGLAKQPTPKSSSTSPTTAPAGGSSAPIVDGTSTSTRLRSFGSWLDDASTLSPGEAWLTLSAQRWASPSFDGADLPVTDLSVGIVNRVHAFVTVPVTRYGYPGAERVREVGDVYVGAKVGLRSADDHRVGLSMTPALEIVGSDSMIDSGMPRVSLVVPVNVEVRHTGGRIYASGGFFTRGAWFLGGALERRLTDSFVATGALSFMGSTEDRTVSEAYGLRHQRIDASGSVAWIASPTIVLFAGVGRTVSAMDLDSTRYAFSFGASLNVRRPGPPPLAR